MEPESPDAGAIETGQEVMVEQIAGIQNCPGFGRED
jgi:hypothetical protein